MGYEYTVQEHRKSCTTHQAMSINASGSPGEDDNNGLHSLDEIASRLEREARETIAKAATANKRKLDDLEGQMKADMARIEKKARDVVDAKVQEMVDAHREEIASKATGTIDDYNEFVERCGPDGPTLLPAGCSSFFSVKSWQEGDVIDNLRQHSMGEYALSECVLMVVTNLKHLPKALLVVDLQGKTIQLPVGHMVELVKLYAPNENTKAYDAQNRLFPRGTLVSALLEKFVAYCMAKGTWTFRSGAVETPDLFFGAPPDVPGFIPGQSNAVLVRTLSGIPAARCTTSRDCVSIGMCVPPQNTHYHDWYARDLKEYVDKTVRAAPSVELAMISIRQIIENLHRVDEYGSPVPYSGDIHSDNYWRTRLRMIMHQPTKNAMLDANGYTGEGSVVGYITESRRNEADEMVSPGGLHGHFDPFDTTDCVMYSVLPHECIGPVAQAHAVSLGECAQWVDGELKRMENHTMVTGNVKMRRGSQVTPENMSDALVQIRKTPAMVHGGKRNPLANNPTRYCAVRLPLMSE